jgi:hypothetical protein
MAKYLSNPANGVTEVITMLPFGSKGCRFKVSGVRHNLGLEETQLTMVLSKHIGGGV